MATAVSPFLGLAAAGEAGAAGHRESPFENFRGIVGVIVTPCLVDVRACPAKLAH